MMRPTFDDSNPDADTASGQHTASLAEVVDSLKFDLPPTALPKLEQYCALLWDWNARINLTRHVDSTTFAARDLSDVLALSRHLQPGEAILDVGSGGGVPGLPLQIIRPDLTVAVCDSVAKKANVLKDIVQKMKLPVAVYPLRGDVVLQQQRFQTVIARAVGPMEKLLTWFRDAWGSMDRLLLVKGPKWVEERAAARHRGLLRPFDLRKLEEYRNPISGVYSVILQISPRKPT